MGRKLASTIRVTGEELYGAEIYADAARREPDSDMERDNLHLTPNKRVSSKHPEGPCALPCESPSLSGNTDGIVPPISVASTQVAEEWKRGGGSYARKGASPHIGLPMSRVDGDGSPSADDAFPQDALTALLKDKERIKESKKKRRKKR